MTAMITVEPDILDIKDGELVLDVGCGEGRHSWEVYKRNHSSIIAFDIDRTSIRKNWYTLERLKKEENANGEYYLVQADVTNLPFKDGVFNKIICSEVLEHVPEDQGAIKELVRVLSEGGFIGVSVPHYFAESICWKISKDYYGFPGGHIRKYKTQQLIELLCANGLRIYALRRKHAFHSLYWILRCLFGIKKENTLIPSLYHRFLVWDLSNNHRLFRWLESLLNLFSPKSIVIYAGKGNAVHHNNVR